MTKNLFESFCKNIEINIDDIKKITVTKNKISECLYNYYKTPSISQNVQFIGAYGRNTAVFVDNIRLLCLLPTNIYLKINVDIDKILDNIIMALKNEFVTCERDDNGNGLFINIDGSISFNLLPGFAFNDGEYIYLNNHKWCQLHLKEEKDMFDSLNKKNNNNVIQLCRMLKVWKNYNDIDISNILLDTFAYHFFNLSVNQIYSFNNYDEMILDFFKFLLPNCKSNNYISFDSKTILRRNVDLYDYVFKSMTIAEIAIDSPKYGLDEKNDWEKIFGTLYFQFK